MRITILTLFPEMFQGVIDFSIIKRARKKNIVEFSLVNIRDFATDKHKSVDSHPYGGGTGMILRVDVVDRALTHVKCHMSHATCRTILLDPAGVPYTQIKAKKLSAYNHLILICGHYEGVDERIRKLVDEEISIGDYILTGGEIPAMALLDSIVRLLPRTLAKTDATTNESFSGETQLLEYPQYTQPQTYNGKKVPEILLSGHHKKIDEWRKNQARKKTLRLRPDLITD